MLNRSRPIHSDSPDHSDSQTLPTVYVFRHQAHRLLLRPSPARLRRHLQASARPQRRRGDRGPHRISSTPATWSATSATSSGSSRAGSIASSITRWCSATTIRWSTPLEQLGEPIYLLDSNPTVERIARLIFEYASGQGLPVVRVTVWETPTSFAEYGRADRDCRQCPIPPHRLRSRRHAGRLAARPRRVGQRAARRVRLRAAARGGDRAHGRRRRGDARRARVRRRRLSAAARRPGALSCHLQRAPAEVHAAVPTESPRCSRRSAARCRSPCSPTSRSRPTREILDGLDLARYFQPDAVVGGDGPLPRKPDPAGLRASLRRAPASIRASTAAGRRFASSTGRRRARPERASAWPATGSGSRAFRPGRSAPTTR